MTDNTQPEAGSTHIIRYALEMGLLWIDGDGRDKVSEALDALDTLEAQLEAIGAGGVSGPLMGQPQAMPDLTALTEHGAKAWAGVDAQGLRDGFTAAIAPALTQVAAIAAGSPVVKESLTTDIAAGAVYAELGYAQQRAIMESERNASLENHSKGLPLHMNSSECRAYDAGFNNGWDRRASHGQAPRDAEREMEMTQQFNAGRQYEAGRIAARVAAAQQAPAGRRSRMSC